MASTGPLFDIQIEGYRDVQGRFARAVSEAGLARRQEMRTLGRRVVMALQNEAPVKTGRLKRGIRMNTRESGQELTLHVTSEAPYTKYVMYGRGPVVARNAKALRFVIDGRVLYRRRVGPAKANPFHKRAMATLGSEPGLTAARISRRIEGAFTAR